MQKHLTFFLGIAAFIWSIAAQEDYADWKYSRLIMMNTTDADGAAVTSDLQNFPILIRLDPENFNAFSQVQDEGKDIRFSDSDGNPLDYAIEQWVDGTDDSDTAAIWVKVDDIYGDSIMRNVIMYWGKSDAADGSNSNAVFGSNNGFLGVYHLDPSLKNAVADQYHSFNNGAVSTKGNIGTAQAFDAATNSQFIFLTVLPERPKGTVSCWFRLNNDFNSSSTTMGIWGIGGNDAYNAMISLQGNDITHEAGNIGSILGKTEYGPGGGYFVTDTENFYSAGTWYHVSMNWDNAGSMRLYVNGTLRNSINNGATVGFGATGDTAVDVIGCSNVESDGLRFFNGIIDEFRMDTSVRSDAWTKLCYENQKPSQTVVTTSGRIWWDTDTASGIQSGNGTWGSDAFWALDGSGGRALTTWPGRGYTAVFGGNVGEYLITVNGRQSVDSLIFNSKTYTIDGDTLDFGGSDGVVIIPQTLTTVYFDAVIDGSGEFYINGAGDGSGNYQSTVNLYAANCNTGATILSKQLRCNINSIADGGVSSALGSSAADAENLIIDNSTLRYVGTDQASTDRLFTVVPGEIFIYSSGGGELSFTNTGAIAVSGSGDRSVEFGGTFTGSGNTFAPSISDGADGVTSVIKSGDGNIWIFSGTHTYTGATAINSGTLLINGALAAGSAVSVAEGAVLGGNGIVAGTVEVAGGIEPGNGSPGKLRIGTLHCSGTTLLNFELGSKSDTLAVTGDVTLDGTLNISEAAGFTEGTYLLITWSGSLIENNLTIGSVSSYGTLKYTDSTLSIHFSEGIIQREPQDTFAIVNHDAIFTVSTESTASFQWQRRPGTDVGTDDSVLTVDNVSTSDNNAEFRCIVTDSDANVDTSRWAALTVIDTPRIASVPGDTTIPVGTAATFSVSITDTARCLIEWWKVGEDVAITTGLSYTFESVTFGDSGAYYCRIGNPADTVYSDTFRVSVIYARPSAGFTYSPVAGDVPLTVQFTDSSNGAIEAWMWDFGDGGHDSIVNPAHTYTAVGAYVATLIVKGPGGSDTAFSDSIVVMESTDNPLVNSIGITDLQYDSLHATIRIKWCVDTTIYDGDLEIGITCNPGHYSTGMSEWRTVEVVDPCTDTVILLDEPLLFDTLYYVRLFARIPGDTWQGGGNSMRDTVRTGHMYRQVVTYFDKDVDTDSTSAFNGSIILWKDGTLDNNSVLVDTLQVYEPDLPKGFISVGTPISFLKARSGPLLYVGFRVTVPKGQSVENVRIFRDSSGVLLVEHGSLVDTAGGIVYVKTADVARPFIPLIDTVRTQVRFLTDIGTVVNADDDVVDSAELKDNIGNVRWWYLYSKANEEPEARDSGELVSTKGVCKLIISGSEHVISSDFGLRARFVVSDGSFKDTFNLSRSVYRDNSDPSTTVGKRWQPLFPTAELEQTDPESLIIDRVTNGMGYNRRFVRLYRWVTMSDNRFAEDKWVEYNPNDQSIKSLFTVEPGKLLWLKTLKNVSLSLGAAKTFSLKDTFIVTLPPEEFTDFGMPYRFGVRMSDIIAASDDDAVKDVYIMHWVVDKETKQYKCETVYSADLPGYMDPTEVSLNFENGGGYSFYNPRKDTVKMRIPPTLAPADGGAAKIKLGKKSATKNWCARLVATEGDGFIFPELNCGYAAGVLQSRFPVPPSFQDTRISFYDRETGESQAHYLCESAAEGVLKEVRFVNNGDSVQMISFRFEEAGVFPKEFRAHLYNAKKKQFEAEGTITVEPKSTVFRWMAVGNEQLRQSFMMTTGSFTYRLNHLYPNPSRSVVNISYSVPVESENHLYLAIFDLRGRRLWDKKIIRSLTPGNHITTWDGRTGSGSAGAGLYVVRLLVVTPKGKTKRRFERRITYLP